MMWRADDQNDIGRCARDKGVCFCKGFIAVRKQVESRSGEAEREGRASVWGRRKRGRQCDQDNSRVKLAI